MTRIVDDDDAEIEAEIQKELDALSAENLQVEDLEEELSSFEVDNKDDNPLPESIEEYLRFVQSRTENIQFEVNECDIVLQDHLEDKQKNEDQILAKKIKEALGDDCHDNPLEIRNKVLTEIEEAEQKEEKEKLQRASQENTMAIDIIRPNISDEIKLLEEEASKQLQELEDKQARKMQERVQMYEQMKQEENERVEQEQMKRRMRQKELEEAQICLNENQKKLQERIEHEKKNEEQELNLLEIKFQQEIKELEEENKKEKKALEQIKLQEAEYQRNKQIKAALIIQKTYRGHRVYKQHKETLESKRQERIHQHEAELEKKYNEEIQRQEEERKMKEHEEKRRIEEERVRKEEKWKKEMEEKKRKEEELRKEEERKKNEEEEKRRREEEERKRLEEKRKQEEDKRRQEEERKKREEEKKRRDEEERRKREEEEKKRLEEERLRKEEEKRQKEEEQKRIEAEKKKKDFEEAKRKEEERKKLEEIKRQKEQEDKKRQEQEKLRIEEEKRKEELKIQETKKRQQDQEEMKRKEMEASEKRRTEKEKKEQESTIQFPSDELKNLEERRQKWLKEHTPWSTTTNEERAQPVAKTRHRPRRPFSASKSLPSITKEQMLEASPPGTSLYKVVRVSLNSCPACNMHGLDCCPSLKSLSIVDCGLLAVEGLDQCSELQEIRLENNKIEYINIKDLTHLQDLTLAKNHLTSVQGLIGCTQLRNLDLSNNKITRIGDLSSCPKLQFLSLDNNQLIMTRGLSSLPRLQSLSCKNNHLPNVKEIDSCQLLQALNLTGNNLQKPPLLSNHVLLQELILDDNSISTLEPLTDVWLPSLRVLSVSQNSLSDVGSLSGLMMLQTLNISHNLISDLDGILPGLTGCKHLSILHIVGNPVNEEPGCRDVITSKLPQLTQIDDDILPAKGTSAHDTSSPFLTMCRKQLIEYSDLVLKHKKELSTIDENTSDPAKIIKHLKLKSQYFDELHQQAIRHLKQHEKFDDSQTIGDKRNNNMDAKQSCLQFVEESKVENSTQTIEENVGHKEMGNTHKMTQTEAATKIQSLWRGWHIRHLIDVQMKKWLAAVSIQAAWRGYNVRSRTRRKSRPVSRARKALWDMRHNAAATTIQAFYRGYRVRRILAQAMQTIKCDSDDEDEFNYDEEVDLSAFDFDHGIIDDGWTPTDTPQIPSRGPPLPNTVQGTSKTKSHQPRQAWRSADSPMEPLQPSNQHHVPDLKLQHSPENDLMSVTSGGQSHLTHRAEEMGVEWGLKNVSTAELMWKRANRMKYNPARKRKMLDPTKRLALFKKLDEANKLKEVKPPPKRQPQRIDYFAAREVNQLPSGANTPISEREVKAQMTYSWVHSQGVVHQDQESNYMDFTPDYSTSTKHKKNIMRTSSLPSKSPVTLPQLDPVQLAGRNVPLVSSPALIQEQMSKETTPRRHSSISEDVRFPPIKTYSVPNLAARSGAIGRSNEKSNSAGARITHAKRDLR